MTSLFEVLLYLVVLGTLGLFFYVAVGGWGLLAAVAIIASAIPAHMLWLRSIGKQ